METVKAQWLSGVEGKIDEQAGHRAVCVTRCGSLSSQVPAVPGHPHHNCSLTHTVGFGDDTDRLAVTAVPCVTRGQQGDLRKGEQG